MMLETRKLLSLLLIPVIITIIALLVSLNISTVFEFPFALLLLNTLFLGIIPFFIAFLSFKVVTRSGSVSVFLMGSGIFIFGLGSIAAGWVNSLPGGPNMTVTIHNTCAFIGSILIFAAALLSGPRAKFSTETPKETIIITFYSAIVIFVTLFSIATLQGLIPPFFVPAYGPTLLRQIILENAVLLFSLSSALFMLTYYKENTDFFFWFSVAFALVAIGLLAVFFQPSVGSLVGWVGRFSQYLGFVFALNAVLIARRISTRKGLPIEKVIADFFVDAEQSYKMLVETANDSIITFDDHDRILLWNSAAERMFGYTRNEAIGSSFVELVVSEESKSYFKNTYKNSPLTNNNSNSSLTTEIVGKRRDKTLFPVELTLSRRRQDTSQIITCILRDLTERKRVEDSLRDSEERYRTVADFTFDWEFWIDPEGRFKYISPAAERILGRSVDASLPADELFRMIIHPDDLKTRITHLEQEKSGQKSFELEFRIVRPDGEIRWINHVCQPIRNNEGKFLGTRGSNRDITNRKRIEEAMLESEKKYRLIFETSNEGIWITDAESKTVLVNQRMAGMLGYSFDEMLGKTPSEFLAPGQEQKRLKNVDVLLKGISVHDEFQFHRKDGSDLWVISSAAPVFDDHGRYMRTISMLADITDRKKTEIALREMQKRTAAILEGIADTFYTLDNQWRFVMVNPAAEKAPFGRPAAELLGRVIWELYPQLLGTRIHQHYLDAAEKHTLEHYEARSPLNSQWYEVFMQGRKGGVDVYMRDITKRKQTEEALRESEARLSLAQKAAGAGTWDWDITKGEIIWSPQLYDLFGVDSRKTPASFETWNSVLHPDDKEGANSRIERALETHTVLDSVYRIIRPDKKVRWINALGEGVYDEHGQAVRMYGICIDITKRHQAEEALREREEQLLRANDLLEAVTKGTDVIIAVQDANFNYLYFNDAYKEEIQRLTGKEITIGTSMIEVFADIPYEQKRAINEWSRVLNGENVNEKIEFGNHGTDRKVYHVLHTPIRDPSGRITAAGEVAFDITKQVEIEDKLHETTEYLDNLITYANAPIIVWNPEFRITLFNHAFEHLTGRKAKDVIGQGLEILLPEKYLKRAMDLIKKTSEGERWESVEIPILHKKGEIRTVLWNSAVIVGADGKTIVSTIAQGQDITERKNIELEYRFKAAEYAKMNVELEEEILQRKSADANLKNTLSLLNASLESTADGILVVDRQGTVTSHNQNFATMWNIPSDILTTQDNQKLISYFLSLVKDPDGFLANMNDLFTHPSRESYDMIELNDGRIFERHSKPQKIGKEIVGRVWSFRDITDRKRSEEKLVASLQEKEVLLREIHHRVKNNLQLITGLLDMTRMRTQDEITTGILTDMMLKIQTMAQIHTRLYESKQFGKIGLTSQFRDQVTALSNIYSHKGHEISCEIHAEEIFLPVDQALPCALVINELLSNSYKHAFKGKKHGTIDVTAVQENGYLRITVKDNGIGIPPDFDIGNTNSLGMKLVRTLVKHQLKGSLHINSHHGTEMIVEFPLPTMRT